ncbi:Phosphatidylinositol 4-phosphate 5-kinase type-1 gamma [Trichinella spiralis]|uniref:Phosphatidylinositol 4-phosphate 5-kinase type-1 gamma n=1 Tax=Trichinella spiralis TaxID=6334 RepID=A0ABR3KWW4_TRISP
MYAVIASNVPTAKRANDCKSAAAATGIVIAIELANGPAGKSTTNSNVPACSWYFPTCRSPRFYFLAEYATGFGSSKPTAT